MKLAHITINVKDMEKSINFYKEVVGLPIVLRFDAGPGREIVFLGEGETKVELIKDEGLEGINIGQDIAIGFGVDNLDETMTSIKEKQIEIHSGPFQPNPKTRFFFIQDPDGLSVQFIEQR